MKNHGQDCEHNLPRQDCSSLARGNFYINIPKTLKGKKGMENGEHQPVQQEQRPARQYFTEYCTNAKR